MKFMKMNMWFRAMILGFILVSAALFGFMLSSLHQSNVANAESASISGGSGLSTGSYGHVMFRLVRGDPKGNGGGEDNWFIRQLVSSKGGAFECKSGVAWGAITSSGVFIARLGDKSINSSPSLGGNWVGGRIGAGQDALWNQYVNDRDTAGYRAALTGADSSNSVHWIGGCVMQPSQRWGSYSYDTQMYNLASSTNVRQTPIQTCVAMYDNYAIGTDGYPRGKSYTKENTPSAGVLSSDGNSIITPYGQLYNTLLQGAYAQKSSNADEANAIRDRLVAAVNTACDQTASMTTGFSIPTDSDFSKSLAKGGIAQTVKQSKKQTIEYPTTNGNWYWRAVTKTTTVIHYCGTNSSWYDNRGKHQCNNVGVVNNSSYDSWRDTGVWNKADNSKNATGNYAGRRFTGTFYCYKGSTDMSQRTSSAEYLNGCWSNVKDRVTVSYSRNSWAQVLHYDMINILCDRKDFLAYKEAIGNVGYSSITDNSVTNGNNRFQGSLVSAASTSSSQGSFPRLALTLAQKGKLSGWNEAKVLNLYASYNASSDPVYTKECPFDCTSSSSGSVASSIGADKNVQAHGAALGRNGITANPSDGKGNLSNSLSNGADMTFFRNNAWNQITSDIWYPSNGIGITFNGTKAKSTIVRRDSNGTPWGTNGATLETLDGTNVFPSLTGGTIGEQTSPVGAVAGMYNNGLTTVLNGQVNQFKIRAPWASEAGRPLRFNVKWEYDVSNKSVAYTGMSGVGDSGSISTSNVDATSDGKCDATYSGGYNNTDDSSYDNSGSGTVDQQDTLFDGTDSLSKAFTIKFVRIASD